MVNEQGNTLLIYSNYKIFLTIKTEYIRKIKKNTFSHSNSDLFLQNVSPAIGRLYQLICRMKKILKMMVLFDLHQFPL